MIMAGTDIMLMKETQKTLEENQGVLLR